MLANSLELAQNLTNLPDLGRRRRLSKRGCRHAGTLSSAPTAIRVLFATVLRHLAQYLGSVGLTTAMTMLTSGWVIVGSLPSNDGTTAVKGPSCLRALDW
jgi:hypothetical protein